MIAPNEPFIAAPQQFEMPAPIAEFEPAGPKPAPWLRRRRPHILIGILLAIVALLAGAYGIQLRRQVYEQTLRYHFLGDVKNGYAWGRNARDVGLFDLYNQVDAGVGFDFLYALDYTPLRLAAVMAWYDWTQRNFPYQAGWRNGFDFAAPMFWGNTIAAMISSLFVFLLVRMWIIRSADPPRSLRGTGLLPPNGQPSRPWRGVVQGLIGALLLWFNPAALWDGYVWGQWEIWIVPFFLGAVYLACLDRWFAAGILLTIGALFKPQLLIAGAVLFVWPIAQLRFGAIVRLLAGMSLSAMLILFPWFGCGKAALGWYMLSIIALALITPVLLPGIISTIVRPRATFHPSRSRPHLNFAALSLIVCAAMLLAWPWASTASLKLKLLPSALIFALILIGRVIPRRLLPHLYAIAVALLILMTIPLFDARTAWFTRGFMFGPTTRSPMYYGPVDNVPAMLCWYFRWPNDNHYLIELPLIGMTSAWALMVSIHAACIVLCGIGAAIQYRRRDSRFLVTMVLPWLTLFLLLTQLQTRYLMWAAVMASLLTGVSAGLTVLGILITLIGWFSIDQNVHTSARVALRFPNLQTLHPHIGWVLLLIAAIMLYHVLVPRKRMVVP